ncbi:uncharacterized protein AMSG_11752 [Thecamonas trahens ATCC 50062]|uniref:Uncharacterized protein n=1 Tax=Thecamonas trahens ATCC 50062 TaxID=461836 RepID=A0A0L0D327_THETB|nr:hypothetical protein AMSG_11752 [Thecamonas trahens ATCC 50062]KNC46714.1 hypothetical protein AMSG_11752 [Thecamonas trahens ATCC 50062]|eukprot:XP_013760501.1 hypothetical protein AMSG_11752 [Thecamonas trahens ATCC 50062]
MAPQPLPDATSDHLVSKLSQSAQSAESELVLERGRVSDGDARILLRRALASPILISVTLRAVRLPRGALASVPLPQTLTHLAMVDMTPPLTAACLPLLPLSLTSLDLSGNALGTARGLTAPLGHVPQLTVLNLADNILSDEACVALSLPDSLADLTLEHNPLTGLGVRRLLESVAGSLTSLNVSRTLVSGSDAAAMAVACPRLSEFDVRGVLFDGDEECELAQALASHSSLTRIWASLEPAPPDAAAFARPMLELLVSRAAAPYEVCDLGLRPRPTGLLGMCKQAPRSLAMLALVKGGVASCDLPELLSLLPPTLHTLIIEGVVLSDAGAQSLVAWMGSSTHLGKLVLRRTELTDEWLAAISRVVPHSLRYMDVSGNSLTDRSVELLRMLALGLPQLEWLDASRNWMPSLEVDGPGSVPWSIEVALNGAFEVGREGWVVFEASSLGTPPVSPLVAAVASGEPELVRRVLDAFYVPDLVPKHLVTSLETAWSVAGEAAVASGDAEMIEAVLGSADGRATMSRLPGTVRGLHDARAARAVVVELRRAVGRLAQITVDGTVFATGGLVKPYHRARVHRAVYAAVSGGEALPLARLRAEGMPMTEVLTGCMSRDDVLRRTPLDVALAAGDARVARHVLAAMPRALVEQVFVAALADDDDLLAPLEYAARSGSVAAVRFVLRHPVLGKVRRDVAGKWIPYRAKGALHIVELLNNGYLLQAQPGHPSPGRS